MVERLLTILLSAFLSSVLLIAGCGGGGDNDDSDGEQGSVIDDDDDGSTADEGDLTSSEPDVAAVFSPLEATVDQQITALEQCSGQDFSTEQELMFMLIDLHGETLERVLSFGLAEDGIVDLLRLGNLFGESDGPFIDILNNLRTLITDLAQAGLIAESTPPPPEGDGGGLGVVLPTNASDSSSPEGGSTDSPASPTVAAQNQLLPNRADEALLAIDRVLENIDAGIPEGISGPEGLSFSLSELARNVVNLPILGSSDARDAPIQAIGFLLEGIGSLLANPLSGSHFERVAGILQELAEEDCNGMSNPLMEASQAVRDSLQNMYTPILSVLRQAIASDIGEGSFEEIFIALISSNLEEFGGVAGIEDLVRGEQVMAFHENLDRLGDLLGPVANDIQPQDEETGLGALRTLLDASSDRPSFAEIFQQFPGLGISSREDSFEVGLTSFFVEALLTPRADGTAPIQDLAGLDDTLANLESLADMLNALLPPEDDLLSDSLLLDGGLLGDRGDVLLKLASRIGAERNPPRLIMPTGPGYNRGMANA